MTVRYKTQGFVFKKEDSGEADRIFSVFTKDYGRLELTGRGIRKIASKLKGSMEVLRVCDVEFIQGKRVKTLTDAISVTKFPSIAQSPEKFRCAKALCQLVDTLVKGQEPDEIVLQLLLDVFGKLHEALPEPAPCLVVYHYFFWNFTSALGYEFQVHACVNCDRKLEPSALYVSYHEGGLLCKACGVLKKEAQLIGQNEAKLLRLFHKKDWQTLCRLKISAALHRSLKHIADAYRNCLIDKTSS